ncbi:MAG: Fe-S cluster assembly protein NifU [Kiritimatiellae bacterium]|jgi:NifU-like protein|nr:Fe-S cluster assembly protein NifU [Kiritimatiellia bacterium]
MWDYTEQVMDHFRNPRNVGKIEDADGVGQVGSLACGDALKLMFNVDEDDRISEVKFQTFGCASAIASSSALTEMIVGLTIEEALKVTNKDIADYLGGLPDEKMHCSVMGREALEAAVYNYRTGTSGDKILAGTIICHCFGVTEEEIERVTRENNLKTVEDVTHFCKAGGACGICKDDIQGVIDRVMAEVKVEESPEYEKPAKKMTIVEKIRLIEKTIDEEIRPILAKDNGGIDLIDVDGNKVVISFTGMCSGCNVAHFTMEGVVQAKLRKFVQEDLVVVEEKK